MKWDIAGKAKTNVVPYLAVTTLILVLLISFWLA